MIHIKRKLFCELKITHAQTVEYRLSHPHGREKDKEGKREGIQMRQLMYVLEVPVPPHVMAYMYVDNVGDLQ